MRKYIHIAKSIKPILTREASETIAEEYSRLRSQDAEHSDMARTQPVTPRALETLIRLSTAHAKARLSVKVEAQDAEAAIEMVTYAYFKKVVPRASKAGATAGEEGSATEGEESEDESTPASTSSTATSSTAATAKKRKRAADADTPSDSVAKKSRPAASDDPYAIVEEDAPLTLRPPAEISVARLATFST